MTDSLELKYISEKYHLSAYASSLIGGRPENQDDMGFAETPLGFLFVVCDGMGGGPGGKTASDIVKKTILQLVADSNSTNDRVLVLKMAASKANDELERKMEAVPSLRGMGSTMVAILINEHSAVIAHIGDSRCYRLRGCKELFRTEDHSLVRELVQGGVITEEQARTSSQSNVVTRSFGSASNHVVEIDEVPFRKGDRFVLCTDGVWGIMPHSDLLKRLGMPLDASAIVKNFQNEIDRIGRGIDNFHDNHTLAIIDINSDSILKDKMTKYTKLLCFSLTVLLLISFIFNLISIQKMKSSPQKAEFERLVSEDANNRQKIENLKDASEKALYTQEIQAQQVDELRKTIEEVAYERDSLHREIDKLNKLVENLQQQLKQKEFKLGSQTGTSQKNKEKFDFKKKTRAQLSRALKCYDDIKNLNKPKLKDAKQEAETLLGSLKKSLQEAAKNPEYSESIKAIINNKLPPEVAIDTEKNGVYRVTQYWLNELEKTRKEVLDMYQSLE